MRLKDPRPGVPELLSSGGLPLRDCILWDKGTCLSGVSVNMIGNCVVRDGQFNGTNGCFNSNPLFVSSYFLSTDSLCVNAGSRSAAVAGLDTFTTSTNGQPDSGLVDIGFHFPGGYTPGTALYVAAIGSDTNNGTALLPYRSLPRH